MRLLERFGRAFGVACQRSVLGVAMTAACLAQQGCDVTDEARLLQLRAVEPAEVTLGETLHVRGEGFPVGADCRVTLLGQWLQPGRKQQVVDVSLPARAVTDNQIDVVLDAASLPEVALHATFVGDVSVSFVALAGVSRVSGRIAFARFEVVAAEVDVAVRYAHLRTAQQTLAALGVVLEDEQENDQGLRIRWATEGSVAANANLRQGDLLTHLGGVRLRTLADFVPAPGVSQLRVGVRYSDRPQPQEVWLSLSGSRAPALTQLGVVVSAAAVLMLVCVAWLAPAPRRLVRFAEPPITRDARAGATAFGAALSKPGRLWLSTAVWPLIAALSWMLLAVAHRWHLSIHLLALSALLVSSHLVATTARVHGRARVRVVLQETATLCLVLAPLACAGLVGGSMTLDGIAERQGALPWQWFAFKAPPLWLACVVFVSASRRLVDRVGGVHPASAALLSIVLAGVGTAVFFGGWQPLGHGVSLVADPQLVGFVAFAGKAWVLMLITTLRQPRPVPLLSSWAWVAVALVSVVLSLLWIRLPLLPAVELAVGYTLFAASLAVAAVIAWRTQRAPLTTLQ